MYFPVPPKKELDPPRPLLDAARPAPLPEEYQRFSVRRGLSGAASGGFAAGVLAIVLPLGFIVCGREFPTATRANLGYDLSESLEYLTLPFIGCAVVGACAGWATFAPAGRYRFARTLAIVFLFSLFVWSAGSILEFAPRPYKGIEVRVYYLLALYVIGPPVVAAAFLTVLRSWKPAWPG